MMHVRFVPRHSSRVITRCAVCAAGSALGAAAGCRAFSHADVDASIAKVLNAQAESWNAGDLEAFMGAYWKSEKLTFSSGGTVHRGWTDTLLRYRTRYPTRADMGDLTFRDLEVTPLGRDAALVLGRWHLRRDRPIGGVFTLVMRRQEGEWTIIHDHTSAEAPP